MVAVVGDDFKPEHEAVLKARASIPAVSRGQTVRPSLGRAVSRQPQRGQDDSRTECIREVSAAHSQRICGHTVPVPRQYPPVVASGGAPEMSGVRLTGGDTMNFWINARQGMRNVETSERSADQRHGDEDARGEKNLPRAARKVLAMGPNVLCEARRVRSHDFFPRRAFGVGSHPFRAPALPSTK